MTKPWHKKPSKPKEVKTTNNFNGINFENQVEVKLYKTLINHGVVHEYKYQLPIFENRKNKSKKIYLLLDQGMAPVFVEFSFMFTLRGITYYINAKGHEYSASKLGKLERDLALQALFENAETSRIMDIYDHNLDDLVFAIKNILNNRLEKV